MNPTHEAHRRSAWLVALVALVAFGASLASMAPAGAAPRQECDPTQAYGCPDDGDQADVLGFTQEAPACSAAESSAAPGTRVAVLVTDVPVGQAVELKLNGATVDTATSGEGGASQGATADTELSFSVPGMAPGRYALVAVGSGFQAECLADVGGFAIAGASAGEGNRPLARTGFAFGTFVVIGAALILVGRLLQHRGHRLRHSVSR